MQSGPTDPLTSILAPAAKSLTCVRPDEQAPEKSPELNPGHILAGEKPLVDNLQVWGASFVSVRFQSPKNVRIKLYSSRI